MSAPLVILSILRGGRFRILQIALLAGFTLLALNSDVTTVHLHAVIDIFIAVQIGLLWAVLDGLWPRLAIVTGIVLLAEGSVTKWFFPHYFAPAACLILYLQVEALRRIWEWHSGVQVSTAAKSRHERRRLARESKNSSDPAYRLRGFVCLLPVICLVSLILRIEARIHGWTENADGPDQQTLLINDWSVRRSELERWMDLQPAPQLVFVRYSPHHIVNFEWVYNHADIMHSHVMWARDLGSEHNKLLLNLVPDRNVWLLEADVRDPQLVRYPDWNGPTANAASVAQTAAPSTDDVQLNW